MGSNEGQMATSRRALLTFAVGAGMGAVSGCLDRASVDTGGNSVPDDGAEDESVSIGMVYATAGLDDRTFSHMAHRGVQEASLESGISFDYRDPSDSDGMAAAQREFATSTDPEYDLICCIGFEQTPGLRENAPEFPDQSFAIVDTAVDEPNVASYAFEEQEGSFQIGHLAAQLTTTELRAGGGTTDPDVSVVGFVGGEEIPPVKKFEAGYRAGVEYADKDVSVLSEYAGDFTDPDGGQEIATRMYEQGADIVYHAAGPTGNGVFRAAQMHERFALGVDSDQSRSDPRYADVILASMTKRVDTAVYLAIQSVVEGSYDGDAFVPLGLDVDGVKIVYGSELGGAIPEAVKTDVDAIGTAIVDGDISIPTEP